MKYSHYSAYVSVGAVDASAPMLFEGVCASTHNFKNSGCWSTHSTHTNGAPVYWFEVNHDHEWNVRAIELTVVTQAKKFDSALLGFLERHFGAFTKYFN